jgi:hypothetical protein
LPSDALIKKRTKSANVVFKPDEGDGDLDTLADGLLEADGLNDAEGDCDKLALADGLLLSEGLVEADSDADGE